MSRKQRRRKQRRRDRRKAKASNWARAPKTSFRKIGHGPT
jgi:hypothetical protein